MMQRKDELFDLGFAVARLSEQNDGNPLLTIMTPASDGDQGQTITIDEDGMEGLIAIGQRMRYWHAHSALAPDVASSKVITPGDEIG